MNVPEPTPDAARRFVLLQLDDVALLLSQQDLRSIEPVLDIDVRAASGSMVGVIQLRSGRWPVFCPSDDLQLTTDMPKKRRICAMLSVGALQFGLVCRSVSSVPVRLVKMVPVPPCMLTAEVPLRGLGLYDGRVVCVSSAERLYADFVEEHPLAQARTTLMGERDAIGLA
jgi:chemotaxis signal transduction protein